MDYVFPAPPIPSIPVRGVSLRFPVHRIYCVGRNFADHAREMGAPVERGQPMFFTKPADAVVPGGGDIPYPPATGDLQHEVELVVAIERNGHGEVAAEYAHAWVYGYTVGIDLTRRDLQAAAKAAGHPWDTAKGFDGSAPLAEIVPAGQFGAIGSRELWLRVNDVERQRARLDRMLFGVDEVLHALSGLYELRSGDLVFMGTPAGVAALAPGDRFSAGIDDLVELHGRIVGR
ncbi:MAG TPA: fumarylacetoacetate hydrolase family protein [Xanthomonadaceae bacterium]|nr:fumarylacetoacetate hydrolase family protein [Xanthomonadaceae bacterium]